MWSTKRKARKAKAKRKMLLTLRAGESRNATVASLGGLLIGSNCEGSNATNLENSTQKRV